MKLLSLFSGIGAFEKALKNIGEDVEVVNFSEIDKYAVKSYCAIHNEPIEKNLWDITKVNLEELPYADLITYGFPCQDISLAGKQQGLYNEDGSLTRSGLFFQAASIIDKVKPKVAIAENVKNLCGKKFKEQFKLILDTLDEIGYNNYWKVLNAKDFGIPQNRERVFIVSIRKDIDNGLFDFPKGFTLTKSLRDVLEESLAEKYYLSDKFIQYLERLKEECEKNGNGFGYKPLTENDVANTIAAKAQVRSTDTMIQVKQIGNVCPTKTRENPNQGRVYDPDYLSPSLTSMEGGNRQPFVAAYDEQNKYIRKDGCVGTIMTDGSSPKKNSRILIWDGYNQKIRKDSTNDGTLTQNCGADLKRNGQGIITIGNYSPSGHDASRIVSVDGVAPTVKENHGTVTETVHYLRIRKLTPLECFRLMGFDDEDFYKAEAVCSNSQLYKQAGNSIVVDVLEHIFLQLKTVLQGEGDG